MKTILAVACAIGAAVFFNIGLYFNKKAVAELPSVGMKRQKGVLREFLSHRLIRLFFVCGITGAVFYVIAISLAPVSVIQPIVSAGVMLLAYLAIRNLGERPRSMDYLAIGLNVCGVILLGTSLAEGLPGKTVHSPTALWLSVGGILALSCVIPLVTGLRGKGSQAAGLGVSVGLLYGTGAVFAKLMLTDWKNQWSSRGALALVSSVYPLCWLCTFLPALITLQAAFQRGMAIVVAPIYAGLAQLVPIVLGMVALKEPLPSSTILVGARIMGFVFIVSGTIILSRRAEEVSPAVPTRTQTLERENP